MHTLNVEELHLEVVLLRILRAKQSWREQEHGVQKLYEQLVVDLAGTWTHMCRQSHCQGEPLF